MSKNKVERDCIQNMVYMEMNSLALVLSPHYSLLKSWQTDKKIVVHFTIYYSPVLNNLQTCNFHFANGSFKRQLQVTQFISFHHSFKCHFNYLKRCQLLTSYDIKDRDFMARRLYHWSLYYYSRVHNETTFFCQQVGQLLFPFDRFTVFIEQSE